VFATVANSRNTTVRGTVVVTLESEPIATRDVTLDPGETRELEFVVTLEDTDGGVIAVNGFEAGTITVGQADNSSAPQSSPEDQAGFEIVLSLVALLVALLAVRRFDRL
jgi:PGF-CTERM protein